MLSSTVHINTEILTLASGTVIPLLVSLVTKSRADPALKAITNAFLAALAAAVVTATTAGGTIQWQVYVQNILLAWVVSVAAYHGLWKPTGAATSVSERTNGFGIGREVYTPVHARDGRPGARVVQLPPPPPVEVDDDYTDPSIPIVAKENE